MVDCWTLFVAKNSISVIKLAAFANCDGIDRINDYIAIDVRNSIHLMPLFNQLHAELQFDGKQFNLLSAKNTSRGSFNFVRIYLNLQSTLAIILE